MDKVSRRDMQVLEYLRENGRHTVTQIGRKLGVPRTTVFEKIKKLRKLGYINRFTAIVDFQKLGKTICACVLFRTKTIKKESLGEALMNSAHTNNVLRLGNDYDYLAYLVFDSMNDLHSYLDILAGKYEIEEAKILYVAKDVKREGFLSKPNTLELMGEEVEEL